MSSYFYFFVFWFMASIPLGPNAINSIRYGATLQRNNWMLAPLGTTFAAIVFCTVVLMGLGIFVAERPLLQTSIRLIGGFYLLYLGLKVVYEALRGTKQRTINLERPNGNERPFWDGFLISITNPKPVILYTSVLSSYLDLSHLMSIHNGVILSITLGTVFIVYMAYGLLGKLASSTFQNEGIFRTFQMTAGGSFLFLSLGILYELAARYLH